MMAECPYCNSYDIMYTGGGYLCMNCSKYCLEIAPEDAKPEEARIPNVGVAEEAGGDKMVDYSKFKEAPVGEKQKTRITEINEGSQNDFRTENYWSATNLTKQQIMDAKRQPCIEIKTENGASMVINMPSGDSIHPKSTLAKFKRTYNKYPEVGMEVDTKLDENGFHRIVVEA